MLKTKDLGKKKEQKNLNGTQTRKGKHALYAMNVSRKVWWKGNFAS